MLGLRRITDLALKTPSILTPLRAAFSHKIDEPRPSLDDLLSTTPYLYPHLHRPIDPMYNYLQPLPGLYIRDELAVIWEAKSKRHRQAKLKRNKRKGPRKTILP